MCLFASVPFFRYFLPTFFLFCSLHSFCLHNIFSIYISLFISTFSSFLPCYCLHQSPNSLHRWWAGGTFEITWIPSLLRLPFQPKILSLLVDVVCLPVQITCYVVYRRDQVTVLECPMPQKYILLLLRSVLYAENITLKRGQQPRNSINKY